MDEEQKEKTGEMKRSRQHDDRSQQDHIPLDLTLEILSRLPAKSILISRSVSKLWSSSIEIPSFINSFASRSSLRPPSVVVTLSAEWKKFVFSFPQHQNPDGSYPPVYSYHQMPNPKYLKYKRSESVQGLILLEGFKIWNPSLRRLLPLPHPKEHIPHNFLSFLGYDPLEGKHKVVCVLLNESSRQADQVLALTLGAQESWKTITKEIPRHFPEGVVHGRCFNGILYYEARVVGVDHRVVMSFDVKSEEFIRPIKFPQDSSCSVSRMIPYEGRLALVDYSIPFDDVDLYILKDADGDEWTHERFLHVPCKSEWRTSYIEFKGITDAGELIFAPYSMLFESFYVLYFDPRRNSTREALFEGIVGEEFRQGYGISSKHTYKMEVFPNHIESLVSCL